MGKLLFIGFNIDFHSIHIIRAVASSNAKKTKEADAIVDVLIAKGADVFAQNKQVKNLLTCYIIETNHSSYCMCRRKR